MHVYSMSELGKVITSYKSILDTNRLNIQASAMVDLEGILVDLIKINESSSEKPEGIFDSNFDDKIFDTKKK